MLISQLNDDGYFIAPVEADESPLEDGVFLIPRGAIAEPPPEIPEGHHARWGDGEWMFEAIPLSPGPDSITLEQAKQAKVIELADWVSQQTAAFEWEGATYQTGQVSRERLMASLNMHQLGIRPDPAPWRTLDNTMIDLSGEGLRNLCGAVYLRHQEITLTSFEFKDQIEALTDIEAVQAFTFAI